MLAAVPGEQTSDALLWLTGLCSVTTHVCSRLSAPSAYSKVTRVINLKPLDILQVCDNIGVSCALW